MNKEENTKVVRFAVVQIKGTQYIVEEGKKYMVEKLGLPNKETIEFKEVLLVSDGENIKIGKPFVEGVKVVAEIVSNKKLEKLTTFKFAAKSRYRRTIGSRRDVTTILVKSF